MPQAHAQTCDLHIHTAAASLEVWAELTVSAQSVGDIDSMPAAKSHALFVEYFMKNVWSVWCSISSENWSGLQLDSIQIFERIMLFCAVWR